MRRLVVEESTLPLLRVRRWLRAIGVIAWLCLTSGASARPLSDTSSRGAELYARHCALCHGAQGRGDGEVAALLSPAPRAFSRGLFHIVSTWNGVPTDDDLVRSIARGVPGSGMPPYDFLTTVDLRTLAVEVRRMAVDGVAQEIAQGLARQGAASDAAACREAAVARLTPGEVIAVDREPVAGKQLLEDGRRGYLQHCAACHGEHGQGRRLADPWSDREFPWSRDFTSGLLAGGGRHEDLVRRILAGMPGAGMPPTRFADPEQVAAVASYVRSLIPPGAEDRLLRRRLAFTARRVATLPADPGDAGWEAIEPVRVVLSPLAWHDAAVAEAWVRFAHDDSDLAVLLEWADDGADDRALGASRFPDGVAVQLSPEHEPPLFGMGSKEHPVNLWHWKAFRTEQIAGMFDLAVLPHRPIVPLPGQPVTDVPLYRPAPGLLGPATEGAAVQLDGVDAAARMSQASGAAIGAVPAWAEGRWRVVLRRSLAPRAPGEIDLRPPVSITMAFAVWNGSADDRGARKSISVWHDVLITP